MCRVSGQHNGDVCQSGYTLRVVCVCVCVFQGLCVCVSGVVCPECDGAVCGGGQEGQVMWVPPTLDHLVTVLPHHGHRKLLSQVSCAHTRTHTRTHAG